MTKLSYVKDGKTAILTINRPEAMNAYDSETIREMGERFLLSTPTQMFAWPS